MQGFGGLSGWIADDSLAVITSYRLFLVLPENRFNVRMLLSRNSTRLAVSRPDPPDCLRSFGNRALKNGDLSGRFLRSTATEYCLEAGRMIAFIHDLFSFCLLYCGNKDNDLLLMVFRRSPQN